MKLTIHVDKKLPGAFGARLVRFNENPTQWVYKASGYYKNEIKAYQVFRSIKHLTSGRWYVPPTFNLRIPQDCVIDDIAKCNLEITEQNSCQLFISGACFRFNPDKFDSQTLTELMTFDALIEQRDRHEENFFIDRNDRVVLIDHGLCFGGFGCFPRFNPNDGNQIKLDSWSKQLPANMLSPRSQAKLQRLNDEPVLDVLRC